MENEEQTDKAISSSGKIYEERNISLAYIFAKYYQEKQINRHLDQGGGYYRWGRTILVSLIGCAITVMILMLFINPHWR